MKDTPLSFYNHLHAQVKIIYLPTYYHIAGNIGVINFGGFDQELLLQHAMAWYSTGIAIHTYLCTYTKKREDILADFFNWAITKLKPPNFFFNSLPKFLALYRTHVASAVSSKCISKNSQGCKKAWFNSKGHRQGGWRGGARERREEKRMSLSLAL